ncbi:MAG: peptidylprolyl isomerase [Chloroflexi bacterium]|nr:peptidylprolyl isomerase [Chloroflexota bacterium]
MAGRNRRTQQPRRRKAYTPGASAASSTVKPSGAFRLFGNYRLFAIVGAVVLFGGYALSTASGGRASAHGGGGSTHSRSDVRGEGVRRDATPEPETASASPARAVKRYLAAPAVAIDTGKHYLAVIETERGAVRVELLPGEAPQAVNNFVFLARDGFYDGLPFDRVIPGFVTQAGDPTGTGIGGPGYDLPFEPSDLPFEPGVLAVARPSEAGAPNNGSQFFFALGRQPTLDGKSTVIGRVLAGLDVLQSLAPRDPQAAPNLPPGDLIKSIAIIES